jgi:hypothetical protein
MRTIRGFCRFENLGLLVLIAGCGGDADMEVARIFQDAQQTFDRADRPEAFLKAAAFYQQILDRGVASGAVLYNQGNAYMQAGQRGRAIAAYRQAQRYRPRDPYLEANLRYAMGPEPPVAQRRPIVQYVFFWQDWLSYAEKFYLVGASALIAFGLGLVAVYTRRERWTLVALGSVVLTLILGLSAGYDWWRFDAMEHGVVVRAKIVARKGNGESYQPAFTAPLAEGTEFIVTDRRPGWVLARLGAGQEGWIAEDAAVVY